MKRCLLLVVFIAICAHPAHAQFPVNAHTATAVLQQVRAIPNVTYLSTRGWEGKLDVYAQRAPGPTPTVIYIHGGGWVQGTKDSAILQIVPYLQMGYSVVNVEYRLANRALAPAAVGDCRCALTWVVAHAQEYGFDADRVTVAGDSAGGHLALMIGLLRATDGFDDDCRTAVEPRVVAIIDFYGITDVAELLSGPGKRPFPEQWPYADEWLGNQANKNEIARRASPLTYVRPGSPPIIAIHGDADDLVPYSQSVRLVDALQKVGVAHELVTVRRGGHAAFPTAEWQRAYQTIQTFLSAHGLRPGAAPASGR
jgi:acetyl esterase/lipase